MTNVKSTGNSQREQIVRGEVQIYLFADSFLKSWDRVFDAKREYEHIERTRKTRKQVLREVELYCICIEKLLARARVAMEMVKKLSSGKNVPVEELQKALTTNSEEAL